MIRRRAGKQTEELLSMLVIPPARRRSTRPLCAMSGLRLTGARLRQLVASGHADAVAEWVRRRADINKGCRGDINKQKAKSLSTLVIPRLRPTAATGVKPAGMRGAASSAEGGGSCAHYWPRGRRVCRSQ